MRGWQDWLTLAIVGFFPGLLLFAFIADVLNRRRKLRDPSTVIEMIDGKRYIVTEKQHPLVRNRHTGRTAALLQTGRERDPVGMHEGQVVLKHRWIKILPLGAKGLGRERWVKGFDWEQDGLTVVRHLDRV
jgi:hypothetical protein